MTSSCAWADEFVLIEINRYSKKLGLNVSKMHEKPLL
jgi:hypothetical protein